MDTTTESPDEQSATLDLPSLGELLHMLRDNDVHSFQAGGITVVFNEKSEFEGLATPVAAATIVDDGHSTSTKRVGGFRDPSLYPWQNGKVLTFTGALE